MIKRSSFVISLSLVLVAATQTSHSQDLATQAVQTALETMVVAKTSGEVPKQECKLESFGSAPIDCIKMTEDFCMKLYAPGNQGNLDLPVAGGTEKIEVRLGDTPNDFSQAYWAHAQAKLQARDKLPAKFKSYLDKLGYFQKLEDFLKSKAAKDQTIDEKVHDKAVVTELSALWRAAQDGAVWAEMELTRPGFSKITTDAIPPDLAKESLTIKNRLKAEINIAIWADSPGWKKVQGEFDLAVTEYKKLIANNKNLSDAVKADWLARIGSVRLELPGSDPKDQSNDTDSCASTEVNAYYDPEKNVMMICAGDFNAEDSIMSIGHELTHAIDVGNSVLSKQLQSEAGKLFDQVAKSVCAKGVTSCPSDWAQTKLKLWSQMSKLGKPVSSPALEAFLSCLQTKKFTEKPDYKFFKDRADEDANSYIASLAEEHFFFDATRPTVTLSNGKTYPNPDFLKPECESLGKRYELDGSFYTGIFFAQEYACSGGATVTPENRLKNAIAETQKIQALTLVNNLPMGGKFSEKDALVDNDYAQSVDESMADAVGLRVAAEVIKNHPQAKTVEDRRSLYLSSISWACNPPSNLTRYVSEAEAEAEFSHAKHPLDSTRRKRFLVKPVQEALGCTVDAKEAKKECNQI